MPQVHGELLQISSLLDAIACAPPESDLCSHVIGPLRERAWLLGPGCRAPLLRLEFLRATSSAISLTSKFPDLCRTPTPTLLSFSVGNITPARPLSPGKAGEPQEGLQGIGPVHFHARSPGDPSAAPLPPDGDADVQGGAVQAAVPPRRASRDPVVPQDRPDAGDDKSLGHGSRVAGSVSPGTGGSARGSLGATGVERPEGAGGPETFAGVIALAQSLAQGCRSILLEAGQSVGEEGGAGAGGTSSDARAPGTCLLLKEAAHCLFGPVLAQCLSAGQATAQAGPTTRAGQATTQSGQATTRAGQAATQSVQATTEAGQATMRAGQATVSTPQGPNQAMSDHAGGSEREEAGTVEPADVALWEAIQAADVELALGHPSVEVPSGPSLLTYPLTLKPL